MKLMLAVENNTGLNSKMDNRFGRAAYFLVYDTEEKKIISLEENKYKDQAQGVGIKTANYVVENGCRVAIGAKMGPKSETILQEAGVSIITFTGGTAKEAIDTYCTRSGV
ncbi:MAG: hypothetical protein GY765_31150 [bacterium]|nr:hypothetical protein [bacterium]